MKLKTGDKFYIVFDADAEPVLTKELEGGWQRYDPQKEKPSCSCRDFVCYLDDNYCAGCGAPI